MNRNCSILCHTKIEMMGSYSGNRDQLFLASSYYGNYLVSTISSFLLEKMDSPL